ncbi:MAG: hypothetical protein AAF449_03900 [Myxococcota bacterium]
MKETKVNRKSNPSPVWTLALGAGLVGATACATQPTAIATLTPATASVATPSADEILQRWVDVRSRQSTGELPTSIVAEQTSRLPAINLRARTRTLIDYQNNRMMQHISSQRFGSIYSGIVDGRVFSANVLGSVAYTEDKAKGASFRSRADHETDFREWYEARTYLGREKIDGRLCDGVRLVPANKGHQPVERWFDVETGVLRKELVGDSIDGLQLPVTVFYSDYRRVDGFLLPFKQVSEVGPESIVIITKSVQTNVELARDEFIPPLDGFNTQRLLGLAAAGESRLTRHPWHWHHET